jgi:lysophospholipase L1-like esterase
VRKSFTALLVLPLASLACSEHSFDEPLDNRRQTATLGDGWVGTWAVAPQGDGTSLQNKTLRQIVHTSIGGSSLKLRVSNVFGSGPLELGSSFVAERTSGAGVALATQKQVLFGGQRSVSIPAGQGAVSDALPFDVKALSDLVVSFHVQSAAGTTTAHQTGKQDNYVANGDVADDETLGGAEVRGSYYFLTGLDVQNADSWGAVVTLGASITDGVDSGHNQNHRWPNYLAQRLAEQSKPLGVLNLGISGNRLLADGAGESALKRFERDVATQAGVRWVIFSDDPINDLGSGNPPSGEQLIAGLKQLVAMAHAAHIEFWCSTLTPFEGSGGWKPQGETARAAIHAFIQSADSGCDAIVDQDLATHDPAAPTRFLPANDAGDHLHPNEAGMRAIAGAVPLDAFSPPDAPVAGAGGAAGTNAGGGGGASSQSGSGMGGAGAGNASGGTATSGANGGTASGAGPTDAAATGGTSATAGSAARPSSDGGCSCGVPLRSASSVPLLALVGLLGLRRRRVQA